MKTPIFSADALVLHLLWRAALLAFLAGWVDSLGFLALHGVFLAHITGNFVLLGVELTAPAGDVLAKLLVLPAFVIGVACAGWMHTVRRRSRPEPVSSLLLLEIVSLATFLAVGLVADPGHAGQGGRALTLVAACVGAFAMGVQNAQSRLSLSALGSTAVMTGNVTQLVLDGLGALQLPAAERTAARKRFVKVLALVGGFAAGCLAGGFAYLAWDFWALLVPIALLGAMALLHD